MLLDAFTYHLSFTPDPALGEVYYHPISRMHKLRLTVYQKLAQLPELESGTL